MFRVEQWGTLMYLQKDLKCVVCVEQEKLL